MSIGDETFIRQIALLCCRIGGFVGGMPMYARTDLLRHGAIRTIRQLFVSA